MSSRIRGLMEKSIWKKNDRDDFRDCEKKVIYARIFLAMASLLSVKQRRKYLENVIGGVFGT